MNALKFLTIATVLAVPAAAQDRNLGAAEFMNSCAQCHGQSGKGDGAIAGFLNTRLPDLSLLQANNGGVFPVSRVYSVIEQSVDVGAHGTTDMPAWGVRYQIEADEMLGEFANSGQRQVYVKTRILALIEHLSSLQEN